MNSLTLQYWSLFSERVLLALLDATVKSVIVFAIAWLAAFALRRSSAAYRHFVWLVAIVTCSLMPLLSLTIPAHYVRLDAIRVKISNSAKISPAETMLIGSPLKVGQTYHETPSPFVGNVSGIAAPNVVAPVYAAAAATSMPRESASFFRSHLAAISIVFFLLLASGSAAALAVRASFLLRLGLIRRKMIVVSEGSVREQMNNIVRSAKLQHDVELLSGSAGSTIFVPMTWGVFRSKVALPESHSEWPIERLRAVLLHEAGHIKRGDWPVQVIASVICALYWFNPLVWTMTAHLRKECELAADNFALSQGVSQASYAEHLLEIASTLNGRRLRLLALPMLRTSKIEERLKLILSNTCSRTQVSARIAWISVIAAIVALSAGSLVRFTQTINGAAPLQATHADAATISTANNLTPHELDAALHYVNQGPWPVLAGRTPQDLSDYKSAMAAYNLANDHYLLADKLTFDAHTKVGHRIPASALREAARQMTIAVTVEPNVAGWQESLSEILDLSGKQRDALPYARRSLDLYKRMALADSPPGVAALADEQISFDDMSISQYYMNAKNYRMAAEYCREEIKYSPSSPTADNAYVQLGIALRSAGDTSGAVAAWKDVIAEKVDPATDGLHAFNLNEAKSLIDSLNTLTVDDYLNEGEPNAKVGEWKYSQTYKMAFKEYRAANIELMICSVYPTPGQPVPSAYVDAIEHYQKGVSFEPRIPEWQEALAETYLLARRYTAAISAAKNAFALYQSVSQGSVSNATFEQLQINEGQDLDMQGNADYYLRQYDAAVSQYQAALKIEPMNSENLAMRINLGRALFAAGHKQAAVAAWKDVLHHLPGGPGNTEISDPAKQLLKNPNAKVYSLQ